MVWIGTHFLIGAGIGFFFAGIFRTSPERTFWIATVFGLWAVAPDAYYIVEATDIIQYDMPHPHRWKKYNIFFGHQYLDSGQYHDRHIPVLIHAVLFTIIAGGWAILRTNVVTERIIVWP